MRIHTSTYIDISINTKMSKNGVTTDEFDYEGFTATAPLTDHVIHLIEFLILKAE